MSPDSLLAYQNVSRSELVNCMTQNSHVQSIFLDSLRDFDFSNIPQESIRKAYQDALPPDTNSWNLAEVNMEEILNKLANFRKLFQFFQGLSQDKNLPKEIRKRCKKKASELAFKKQHENVKYSSAIQPFSNQENKLQSYLIAKIEKLSHNGNEFLLNAWLISDYSLVKKDLSLIINKKDSVLHCKYLVSHYKPLLDENEQQTGKICNLNEVSSEFNKFLTKALHLLVGKSYCLTIEFFLPENLMGMEIDCWKIDDPVDKDMTLGMKYPICLRSLARLELDYLLSNYSSWRGSWDKVRELLINKPNQDCFETLAEIENFDWRAFQVKLNKKIGLKVTCHHPESMREYLFKAIRGATTPIAIWTRTDIPNLDQVKAIDEILTSQPLCALCESVRQTRQIAGIQTGEHLGHHLALLWENPYRLTPDIMPLVPTEQ